MSFRPGQQHSAPNSAMFGMQTHVPAADPLKPIVLSSDYNRHHAKLDDYAPGTAPAGLGSLGAFLTETTEALDALNFLRGTPDPEHTEMAHVMKVNLLGTQTIDRLSRSYDRAAQAIRAAISDCDADLHEAGRLTPTSQAAELRSIIRAMPEAERYSTLMAAIADGQTEIVAAALSAPGLASGLTDKQRDALKEHHLKQVAPDLLAKRRTAQHAQTRLATAFDSLLMQADEFTAKDRAAQIKAIQQNARKHDLALGLTGLGL